MVKINFDGAVFTKEKKAGVGMVVRDAKGLVLAYVARTRTRTRHGHRYGDTAIFEK